MQSRARLRPWLESMIDSSQVSGLVWLNVERTKFKIPWKHRSKQDWTPESGQIFLEWAKNTGKFIEGVHKVNYPLWKTRLRCAFNKAKDLIEQRDESNERCTDPYRVYLLSDVKLSKRDRNDQCTLNSPATEDTVSVTDEEQCDAALDSISNLFLQQNTFEENLVPTTVAELESIDSVGSFDDFPADLKGTEPLEFGDSRTLNVLNSADEFSAESHDRLIAWCPQEPLPVSNISELDISSSIFDASESTVVTQLVLWNDLTLPSFDMSQLQLCDQSQLQAIIELHLQGSEHTQQLTAVTHDQSQLLPAVSRYQSQLLSAVSHAQSQQLFAVSTDQSQLLKAVSHDQTQLLSAVSRNQSQLLEAVSRDQSQLMTAGSHDRSQVLSAFSEDQPVVTASLSQDLSQLQSADQSQSFNESCDQMPQLQFDVSLFLQLDQLDYSSIDQSHLGSIYDLMQDSLKAQVTNESYGHKESCEMQDGGQDGGDHLVVSLQIQNDFYACSQNQENISSLVHQSVTSSIENSCEGDDEFYLQCSSESPAMVIANADQHLNPECTSETAEVLETGFVDQQSSAQCPREADEVLMEVENNQSANHAVVLPSLDSRQSNEQQTYEPIVLQQFKDKENFQVSQVGSTESVLKSLTASVSRDLQKGLELTVNYCGKEVLQKTITNVGRLLYRGEGADDEQTPTTHSDDLTSSSSQRNPERVHFPKWNADAMQKSSTNEEDGSNGKFHAYLRSAGLSLLCYGLTSGISLWLSDTYDVYACRQCRSAVYFISELETNGKAIKIPSDRGQCKPVPTKIFSYYDRFLPALKLYTEGCRPRPDPITYMVLGQKLDGLEDIGKDVCIYVTVLPRKVLHDLQLADSMVALRLTQLRYTGNDGDFVQPANECNKRARC